VLLAVAPLWKGLDVWLHPPPDNVEEALNVVRDVLLNVLDGFPADFLTGTHQDTSRGISTDEPEDRPHTLLVFRVELVDSFPGAVTSWRPRPA
jgi:hypothetical protein